MRVFKATGRNLRLGAAVAVISTVMLAGCSTSEVLNQGYVVDQTALDLTPVGSSREQVLLSLGTPSTTATFDNEVFLLRLATARAWCNVHEAETGRSVGVGCLF
jgi:hypothetical protein